MKNHQFQSLHQKYYTLKTPRSVLIIWIMSRYSKSFSPKSTQFWFVPSECPSNPLHFKGQSLLHNHILLSLMGNSDFLSRPKFAIDSVKSWPSNCFFFVTSSLKSSIMFPTESCLLVAQFEKKDSHLGWVKSEIDWKCSEISTFWLTS